MPDVSTEQVLVVPTQLLHQLGYFQGFMPGVAGYLDSLLSPRTHQLSPARGNGGRPQLQTADTLRPVLPHPILRTAVGLPVHARDGAG